MFSWYLFYCWYPFCDNFINEVTVPVGELTQNEHKDTRSTSMIWVGIFIYNFDYIHQASTCSKSILKT